MTVVRMSDIVMTEEGGGGWKEASVGGMCCRVEEMVYCNNVDVTVTVSAAALMCGVLHLVTGNDGTRGTAAPSAGQLGPDLPIVAIPHPVATNIGNIGRPATHLPAPAPR